MPLKILITGATGGLGSSTLHHLQHTLSIPTSSLAASSSSPSKASDFNSIGIPFRHADFSSPASLLSAFNGIENLLFVSTNTLDHARRQQQHQNVVDAAVKAGVKHVWYTSLAFDGREEVGTSKAMFQIAHQGTELMLKRAGEEHGLRYTILRMGAYADAWPLFCAWYPGQESVRVPVPEEGERGQAFATREELAEGVARLLVEGVPGEGVVVGSATKTGSEVGVGRTLLLTGPRAVTLREIVQAANEGHPAGDIRFESVSPKDYVRVNSEHDQGGKPSMFFDAMLSYYDAVTAGDLDVVDPLLEKVLGRRPIDGVEFVRKVMAETEGVYTWHQNSELASQY
ncbi:MAG: hypothetical protein Q9160_005339 [Pyrenula sp. 1 TL-2023]